MMQILLFVALFKMSRQGEELLLFGVLAVLALLGLILLYTELREVARARKYKKEVMSFPDRVERVRKAG
jgi:hypothetical protein